MPARRDEDEVEVKQSHKTLLLWVLLIVMFLAIWKMLEPGERRQQVSFSEFVTWVHQGQVPEVRVKDREYSFTHVVDGKNQTVETLGPVADEALMQDLQSNPLAKDGKFKIYFEKDDTTPFWSSTLVTLLPMLFIGIMFFLFMRQLQAGGGKAMSFGKAKARMLSDSQNKITFADVPASTRRRTKSKRSSPSSRTRRSSRSSAAASPRAC